MDESMSFFDKIGSGIDKVARIFSQLSVLIMVVVVLIGVFMRYFIKEPLVWGDELAKYSLVYMTFIGASVALRDKGVAAMELLIDKLPGKTRIIVNIVIYLLEIILLSFLFHNSINLLLQDSVQNQISPGLLIPMSWVYFSMPLGIGLMVLQAILLLYNESKEFFIKGGNR
ncbi:MAG TPA: hypothetical protein DHU59_02790 [Clostridiales bacterium]|nr:hypothetical protein [Clostridiales bacterium]